MRGIVRVEDNDTMAKDPMCGMTVDEDVAEKKGLVIKDEKGAHYFCSQNCLEKYHSKGKIAWYQSAQFGRFFPIVLAVVLIVGALWSFLTGFMALYMGIFFIVFSLMKMPAWKGFVTAFSGYDLIAQRVRWYAWAYPAIEFILGVLYLANILLFPVAVVTIIILGIGGIGVAKKILKKEKFQCACLGTTINLPLTKVTLLEDVIMVVMAIVLLVGLL